MGRNDEQVLCLVSEAGAGAKYMHIYDMLPSGARRAVREAPINVCMACFEWADDYKKAEAKIEAMHRKDLNRRREYYAGE